MVPAQPKSGQRLKKWVFHPTKNIWWRTLPLLHAMDTIIPTSFTLKKASPQQAIHTGYIACPGIDTWVQGISVLRLIQRTRPSK
jgi:hypothetical protein